MQKGAAENYVEENCANIVADVLTWRRTTAPEILDAFDEWAENRLFEHNFADNPPIVAAHMARHVMRLVRAAHEADAASVRH